jgi:HSP20 family molecular chaperone IbpA
MTTLVEQQIINGTKRFIDTIFARSSSPYMDVGIYERGAALFAEMYIPHIQPSTLEIYSGRWHLTIKGVCKSEDKKIPFKQVIRLPKKIKKEEVFAQYNKGILEVILPITK